ncbi:hypothetical protein [Haloplanus aerogenes]|uniref:Uncharacterized protein n=1 Tax=Haloplanus aerogenes TaxID=660522 RepID=A0A3M0DPX9_9EURY|nr:hypothetical protein [Haloplanus aerogenes]AZH24585.1 hypothetical protein DU502_03945 [Haloplanus aerogenes]RMB23757.1 hypothetical protein ATH50_0987 [Haloplanus aerogenes]
MPLTRRTLLGSACVLTGLSGCLGGSESSPTGTPTATPTPTATRTGTVIAESCSASDPPAPTGAATDPKPYPEQPSELSRESVGSFVEAYERVYQYNSMLAEYPDKIGRLNDLDVSINEITVTVEEETFVVGVTGQTNTGITTDDGGGSETPTQTPLPMGHWPFETTYKVSDEFVRRGGTVYECW